MLQRIDINDVNYGNFSWRITNGFARRGRLVEKETVEQNQVFTVYYVLGTVLGIGDPALTKQTEPPSPLSCTRRTIKRTYQ